MTDVVNGLFGPGIFGTGIDLSALDGDTALRLGKFMGEQMLAADARGYARAISYLQDHDAFDEWWFDAVDGVIPHRDDWRNNALAADYLKSRAVPS